MQPRSDWCARLGLAGLCLAAGLVALEILGFALAGRGGDRAPVRAERGDHRHWAGKVEALRARLAALAPRGTYAIVDTAANVLTVKQGDRVLRRAVISAGSGSVLDEPSGKRRWVFDTPRGVRVVQSKIEHPVWVRPDWAFIEEGAPPPAEYAERLDPGAMGDYAIGLGEGYFIHGTLYTRLLGRNVTHGCVRVGDRDLAAIFQALGLGSRVILF
ncbi:MAG: L,D-transpeptidase [Candidatus Methylomirabilales bacterium]